MSGFGNWAYNVLNGSNATGGSRDGRIQHPHPSNIRLYTGNDNNSSYDTATPLGNLGGEQTFTALIQPQTLTASGQPMLFPSLRAGSTNRAIAIFRRLRNPTSAVREPGPIHLPRSLSLLTTSRMHIDNSPLGIRCTTSSRRNRSNAPAKFSNCTVASRVCSSSRQHRAAWLSSPGTPSMDPACLKE